MGYVTLTDLVLDVVAETIRAKRVQTRQRPRLLARARAHPARAHLLLQAVEEVWGLPHLPPPSSFLLLRPSFLPPSAGSLQRIHVQVL